jgi:sortase (surface protein transpeptidase)
VKAVALAGAAGLVGIVLAAKGFQHREPPQYRIFGGPQAIWNIPDGPAMHWSAPRRLRIPSAGVDARIAPIAENPDGGIGVPGFGKSREAAWYDGSPPPGERGSSIIVGHYDDDKGEAVFYNAYKIKKNDPILVTRADGSTGTFRVDALEQVSKSLFPTHRVYGRVHYAGLRLITCGGKFNKDRRHYADNIIIYAHLVKGSKIKKS